MLQCSGKEHLLEIFYMLYILTFPASCMTPEGARRGWIITCAPVLPPKQNVSKIGSVEVPITFETCLEMLVRFREITLEMATCYCTCLVCRQTPP